MMRILTHRYTQTHAHTHPYTHHTHTHMNKHTHTHTAIHTCIQVSHTITTSIYLTRFTIIQTLSHSRKLILTNTLYSTSHSRTHTHFLYLTRDSGEREIECETGEIDKTTKLPGFQFSVALAQMRWTRPLNKHSLVFHSKTIYLIWAKATAQENNSEVRQH